MAIDADHEVKPRLKGEFRVCVPQNLEAICVVTWILRALLLIGLGVEPSNEPIQSTKHLVRQSRVT